MLKSTPPSPRLGAEVATREPSVKPPAPGKACPRPLAIVLGNRLEPSVRPMDTGAALETAPPRLRPKPALATCGAAEVWTEPSVRPPPMGAVDEAVREKGVAEAEGLLKARLKPVEAAVEEGMPADKRDTLAVKNPDQGRRRVKIGRVTGLLYNTSLT